MQAETKSPNGFKRNGSKADGTETNANPSYKMKSQELQMAKKKTPTRKPAKQIATMAFDPASVTAFDDLPSLTKLNFVGLIAVDDAGGGGKDGRGNHWTPTV